MSMSHNSLFSCVGRRVFACHAVINHMSNPWDMLINFGFDVYAVNNIQDLCSNHRVCSASKMIISTTFLYTILSSMSCWPFFVMLLCLTLFDVGVEETITQTAAKLQLLTINWNYQICPRCYCEGRVRHIQYCHILDDSKISLTSI